MDLENAHKRAIPYFSINKNKRIKVSSDFRNKERDKEGAACVTRVGRRGLQG